MEFKRKVYNELFEWKKVSNGRSAIMLQGARRVGKSTIVEKFAREQYKSYILIDFVDSDDGMRRIFTECRTDLNMMFNRLQLKTGIRLYERESAIIFDEVQVFPLAREMIKNLVKDGRYDYIETGSLITVKSKISGIRIPSEEHKVNMYPMDFEEWLWANGDEVTADMLRSFMKMKKPLGDGTHNAILRKYIEYMVIGGMPQVVSAYLDSHDIMEADQIKNDILNLYRDDIHKMPNVSGRVLALFNSTPAILSSPHKVLSPGKIEKGTRKRDYDAAVEWLCDAMIFNRCRCGSDPGVAIGLSEDVSRVKCYFIDTGLLITLAFQKNKKFLEETYSLLLEGKLSINRGMMFENMVSQELVSTGHELWFTEFEKKNEGRKYEVDFILPGVSDIIPIEVKSGKSTPHASLDKLMEKYEKRIEKAYVIHSKDLRSDGKITYVPIYMMQFADWRCTRDTRVK